MANSSSTGESELCVLVVTAGPDMGTTRALTLAETTIGRGGDQTFPLGDSAASRRHAIITRDGGSYRITDLGSSNGTLLNGTRTDTAILEVGDEIFIGNTRFRFERAPTWDGMRTEEEPPAPLPLEQASPQRISAEYRQIREVQPTERVKSVPGILVPMVRPAAADEFKEVQTEIKHDAMLDPPPAAPSPFEPDETEMPKPLVATLEPRWRITVGSVLSANRTDLHDIIDRCSGMSWVRGELVAASSHADFVEFIAPTTLVHQRVALPKPGARSAAGMNPEAQLQIEAVLAARDYRGEFLLAFGAGTTPESRKVVRIRYGTTELELSVVEAHGLYESLLSVPGVATSTLNIEGAALISAPGGAPPRVRLLQRGNGKPRGSARVTSATVDVQLIVLIGYLERCRRDMNARFDDDLINVRRYDLGAIDGVALAFSDGCGLPDGRMLYVAVAERCIDAGLGGPNFGTVLGVIEADGRARHALLCEADGTPTKSKVAALAVNEAGRVYVALQATAGMPPRLCRLEIAGLPVHR